MNRIADSLSALTANNIPVKKIDHILDAALQAADPFLCVKQNLECTANSVRVGNKSHSLYPDSRIVVVGIGKASLAMSEAAQEQIGDQLSKGLAVCKHNSSGKEQLGRIDVLQGSHPVPDERSVNAALRIRELVNGLSDHDIVILLISGGGSALACLPAPGIKLEDMQAVISELLKSGASINELNAVRKHLDLIKGGGLLKMAYPARVAALVISDVVNNPLDVIASGPAVPDPSTFQDVRQILEQYLDPERIPGAILERVAKGCNGSIEETLKTRDEAASRIDHTVIASNQVSARAALETAYHEGFDAEIITNELVGEARLAGEKLTNLLIEKKVGNKPYLGIAGGETTVKVTGQGLGGRNLEAALAAVRKMNGVDGGLLITLATDGEDGPTDSAGAYVTSETMTKAAQLGLDPERFLNENDAYHFFEKVGGLILTGPSGTNVNDLNFIFRF